MISSPSPCTAVSGFALTPLSGKLLLSLAFLCIYPSFWKDYTGNSVRTFRLKSYSQKEKKALEPSCIGSQSQVPRWAHQPPGKRRSLRAEHWHCLPGAWSLKRGGRPAVLSPPCCLCEFCPRREVNGSSIPNIWGCHLLLDSEEDEPVL